MKVLIGPTLAAIFAIFTLLAEVLKRGKIPRTSSSLDVLAARTGTRIASGGAASTTWSDMKFFPGF
jgi:hypothetical protein